MDAAKVIDIIEPRLRPVASFLGVSPEAIGAVVSEFRNMRVEIDNLKDRVGRLESGRGDGE